MFCSWITSSSSLDMIFLLGGIHFLKTFLDNSSTFLNIGFWERMKGRPSEIIRSDIAIVRRVSLEVISFWELPSNPKIGVPFETLLVMMIDLYQNIKLEIFLFMYIFTINLLTLGLTNRKRTLYGVVWPINMR